MCGQKNRAAYHGKAANNIQQPAIPAVYMGPRQYEAENFDVKKINNHASGYRSGGENYSRHGPINFGKTATAARARYGECSLHWQLSAADQICSGR